MAPVDQMAKFDRDLVAAKVRKWDKPTAQFYKEVVLLTFDYISANAEDAAGAYGSPVLTGRYYASHTVALNAIDTSVKPPAPGHEANYYRPLNVVDVLGVLSAWKPGDTTYIANSLPYAKTIENTDPAQTRIPWSYKTPDGVYQISVEAVKLTFKAGLSGINFKVSV